MKGGSVPHQKFRLDRPWIVCPSLALDIPSRFESDDSYQKGMSKYRGGPIESDLDDVSNGDISFGDSMKISYQ